MSIQPAHVPVLVHRLFLIHRNVLIATDVDGVATLADGDRLGAASTRPDDLVACVVELAGLLRLAIDDDGALPSAFASERMIRDTASIDGDPAALVVVLAVEAASVAGREREGWHGDQSHSHCSPLGRPGHHGRLLCVRPPRSLWRPWWLATVSQERYAYDTNSRTTVRS